MRGAEESKGDKIRVLCVDDSTYNLFVLKELINQINDNVDVETALNGEIAVKMIKEQARNGEPLYDLILMDLQMPIMDGF